MIRNGIIAIVVLGLAFVMLAAALPEIVNQSETARTNPAQDSALACATGSGTSCDVTITAAHAHRDTTDLTVTETSPGSVDRTSTSSLDSDLTTLTISGLTTGTSYLFTVDYSVVDPNISGSLNQLLVSFPLLLVVGLLAVIVLGTYSAFGYRRL